MALIFLAGVHGVGKSFLGSIASSSLIIPHFSASQLIREEMQGASWGINKRANNLDSNQIALINAIQNKQRTSSNILLDGHFVLRNSEGALIRLTPNIFKMMKLSVVILLTDNADTIQSRLYIRDQFRSDINDIAEIIEAENSHAEFICRENQIPLVVIHEPTESLLIDAIKKYLPLNNTHQAAHR